MENMEVLVSKLTEAETTDDVIRLCAEAGYEVTEEQLKTLVAEADGELNEDALDDVAGGIGVIIPIGIRTVEALLRWYAKNHPRLRPIIPSWMKRK